MKRKNGKLPSNPYRGRDYSDSQTAKSGEWEGWLDYELVPRALSNEVSVPRFVNNVKARRLYEKDQRPGFIRESEAGAIVVCAKVFKKWVIRNKLRLLVTRSELKAAERA